MLNIYIINSKSSNIFLNFDHQQSLDLRETKRICSILIGTKSNSNLSKQTTESSLPLELSLEEVCLLIENYPNEINLFKSVIPSYIEKIDLNENYSDLKTLYGLYEKDLSQKQVDNYKKNRNEQMILMKDKILNGKRKKLNDQLLKINSQLTESNIDREKLLDDKKKIEENLNNLEFNFNLELEKLSKNDLASNETEIFFKTPKFYFESNLFKIETISLDQFKLLNKNSFLTCKYLTFKYLWSCGYYITSGAKFGGDFLVYPGDPSKFHSQFILVCIENQDKYNSLSIKNLITYARMATTVKKTFLISLCTNKNDNSSMSLLKRAFSIKLSDGFELSFLSMNWSHI